MQKNNYGFGVDEKAKKIDNEHSDEAIELKDENDKKLVVVKKMKTNVTCLPTTLLDQAGARGAKQAAQSVLFQEGKVSLSAGAQNPNDYSNLQVGAEVKQYFEFISRYFYFSFKIQLYKVPQMVLDAKLKPFIPDYLPETLVLVALDESALNQSKRAKFDLLMRENVKVTKRAKILLFMLQKMLITTQRKLQHVLMMQQKYIKKSNLHLFHILNQACY
ncbi:unnamed protein product [Paramecium primaurelia]|uniref:Uncharacterized protein n=1 Tax=Paramecium primaurelia TaxID=5886 RepID=A0A8S1MY31_PARPR|nr:unnamed protein product [Paramecium primaurelia]